MNMKEKLESLGRNSIQLKIARKETYKLGATRFGGKPDVPPDFVWPTYEGESYDHVVKDRPLTFLAQFNCEELAQFDKEHLLPDHGLLSFFYETDTQCWGYDPKDKGCARVYWFEDFLWSKSRWTQNTPILPGRISARCSPMRKTTMPLILYGTS